MKKLKHALIKMKNYSYNLKIIIFSYSLTYIIRETARVFYVSPNTFTLARKLFTQTGDVEPVS